MSEVYWIRFFDEEEDHPLLGPGRYVLKEMVCWVIDEDEESIYVAPVKNHSCLDIKSRWECEKRILKSNIIDMMLLEILEEAI